jgi:uncharacterized RDD family membrane protein YckC
MGSAGTWGAHPWGEIVEHPRSTSVQSRIHHGDVTYGRFWERFAGFLLDGIVVGLAQSVASLPILAVAYLGGRSLTVCEVTEATVYATLQTCAPNYGLYALLSVAQLPVWFALVPRRLGRRGATIGMGAMGLRLVTAGDQRAAGTAQAFWRAVVASGLFVAGTAPLVVGVLREVSWPTWASVAVVCLTPTMALMTYLWNVVDPRYQTLHDKVAGTVVIRR